jgi:hypothetical protein
MRTYRRKTKVVGKQTFINQETGELVEMNVIQAEERDFNFEKLWMGHVFGTLDIIGNKKIKLVTYVMQNRNRDNIFFGTYRDLEKKLNISSPTIAETFKVLQDNDFLVMVQQGVYRINPDIIFKGTNGNRLNVLIMYQKEKSEKNGQAEEEEQIIDPIIYIDSELEEAQQEIEQAQKRIEKLQKRKQEISAHQEVLASQESKQTKQKAS